MLGSGSHLRKPPEQRVSVEPQGGADLGERGVLLASDALVVGHVRRDEEDVAALLLGSSGDGTDAHEVLRAAGAGAGVVRPGVPGARGAPTFSAS